MTEMKVVEEVITLLKTGKVERAIDTLLKYLEGEDEDLFDEVVALSGQLSRFKKGERLDTNSNAEVINRIETAVLSIARQIKNTSLSESELRLESHVKIDYSDLQILLREKAWKDADVKTAELITQLRGDNDSRGLRFNEIPNLPCKDLRTIDNLWSYYSSGKFGFGTQLRVLIESEYDLELFGKSVGWKNHDLWIAYSDVIFNLLSPRGHLPIGGNFGFLEKSEAVSLGNGMSGLIEGQVQVIKAGLSDIFNPGGVERFGGRFIREFGFLGGNGFALWWAKGRIPLLNKYRNCGLYKT